MPNGRHGAYTSARLLTQGLFFRSHGNFEARIKVDRATGSWPAWWMIGDNYGQVGRPQCGEIDMVEVYGQPGWDADSTVHCAGNNGNDMSREAIIPGGVDTGWHIYHLRWDGNTGVIQFSKDNQVYMGSPRASGTGRVFARRAIRDIGRRARSRSWPSSWRRSGSPVPG